MFTHLALGYRTLRRTPLLWTGIVLTLGLALAATVIVFSLVNAYLIRPLPYGDASRLAVIYEYSLKSGRDRTRTRLTSGNTVELQERLTSFSRIATVFNASVTVHAAGTTEVDFVQRVTPAFFPMIGARPLLGQIISPANAEPGGQRAVLLSSELWRRRFGADAAIVGKSIQLDDANYTVVGVMPADFRTPTQDNNPQAWLTMLPADYPRTERSLRRHYVLGELAPGRSLAAARAELDQAADALRREYAGPNIDRGLTALAMREDMIGTFDRQLLLLQGAVFLVLLVACLNCLCLLLARAIQRRREFAVRLALGASRGALLKQLFSESLWLALPAGALADALAAFAAPLAQAQLPPWFGTLPQPVSDATVHLAVFSVSLAIAFLFSLVPLLQTRRLNLEAALRDGGRNLSSAGSARATRWLATGQIAMALALLVGAALLVRSYRQIQTLDVGLPVAELDYFRVGLRGDAYRDVTSRQQFFDRVADNLRQIPGVREVGVTPIPFAFATGGFPSFIQEGDGLVLAESPKRALPRPVSPSFRTATDLKLVAGRWLDDTDDTGKPLVTVINAALARKYWPDQNPVGKRVQLDGSSGWIEIVGVVEDTIGLGNQPGVVDSFYLTLQQRPPNFLGNGFLVRFAGAPPKERLLEQAVWAVDPNMQFWAHQLVADTYAQSAWQTRFVLTLVGAFSALAVGLSLAGIYAVLSFLVSRRVAEFGVRIALGATRLDVTRLVLRDAARMTLLGVALGCFLAWLGTRSLADLLYNIPTVDAVSYALSAGAMALACTVAALLPAYRATQVDPIVALRAD